MRTREQTEQLHRFIFNEYVWLGRGQASIIRKIEDDATLRQRFGGDITPALISYHVKQITEELENSIDYDALEKFTGEYIRYQQTLDSEIDDVDQIISLIDKEKRPELWLQMKRFRKELLDSRIKALADHELPLAVKKFKKERNLKVMRLMEVPKELPNGQESDKPGNEETFTN